MFLKTVMMLLCTAGTAFYTRFLCEAAQPTDKSKLAGL